MRDDSLVERGWAKVWGAPFVAVLAGLIIGIIYIQWTRYHPPRKDRAHAIAKCHQAYSKASSEADSARVDAQVVIWRVSRSTTRDITCEELRVSADW